MISDDFKLAIDFAALSNTASRLKDKENVGKVQALLTFIHNKLKNEFEDYNEDVQDPTIADIIGWDCLESDKLKLLLNQRIINLYFKVMQLYDAEEFLNASERDLFLIKAVRKKLKAIFLELSSKFKESLNSTTVPFSSYILITLSTLDITFKSNDIVIVCTENDEKMHRFSKIFEEVTTRNLKTIESVNDLDNQIVRAQLTNIEFDELICSNKEFASNKY